MALKVHPGYMGYAVIGGTSVRYTDANISAKQDINIPDLIMGHWDRLAYNANKIEVTGSISGPVTENFASGTSNLWDWAVTRDTCGEVTANDVQLYYFCGTGGGQLISNVRVNSFNFSCTAGDIAQFSLDVLGTEAGSFGAGSSGVSSIPEEKLITWDQTGVTVAGLGTNYFQSFEFTIANNIEPVYAIGQSNLFPFEVVPGLRTITGSLSAYDIPTAYGYDTWADLVTGTEKTITFSIGTSTFSMKVFFHRVEPTASVGPIVSTVGFTGAGAQTF